MQAMFKIIKRLDHCIYIQLKEGHFLILIQAFFDPHNGFFFGKTQ